MHTITSKFHAVAGTFRRLGRQPVFDWYFSLGAFFVLLALVATVCVIGYVRLGYADVSIPTAEGDSGAIINFSVESIDETLGSLKERALNAGAMPASVLVDPSL
jgi:hypothetical protein